MINFIFKSQSLGMTKLHPPKPGVWIELTIRQIFLSAIRKNIVFCIYEP
jgi:hypothetical protein